MTIFFSVLSALRFFQLLVLNCSWTGCLSHCLFKLETPFPNALWTLPEQRLPIFKILNLVRPTDCKNLGNRAPLLSKVNLMGIYSLHSWAPQCESLFSALLCTTGSLPTMNSHGLLCSQTTSSPFLPSLIWPLLCL